MRHSLRSHAWTHTPRARPRSRERSRDQGSQDQGASEQGAFDAPAPSERLIDQLVPGLPGIVRSRLTDHASNLLNDGVEPVTVEAAVIAWSQRPGAAPGLLPYLAADLQLEERIPKKPNHRIDRHVAWCGRCDETCRFREGPDGWYRCPECHPLIAPEVQEDQAEARRANTLRAFTVGDPKERLGVITP